VLVLLLLQWQQQWLLLEGEGAQPHGQRARGQQVGRQHGAATTR
jgi:hypothetical protein